MLNVGKLDSQLLKDIVFKNITFKREDVLARAGIGEDCAVLDFGEYECIMSTDPITAAISEIGRLAVHITCNDIATNGIEPMGIMLAVMLPVGTTQQEVEEMMKQAGQAAESLGVEIIGGHTEITPAVNKPVIVSTAIGRSPKGHSKRGKGIRQGDWILMTKNAGIEGTGIIAFDKEDQLMKLLTKEEIEEAKKMLEQVSVVKEGLIAGKTGILGMHDITEGGILGAVWEMCQVSGLGAEVWLEKVPVAEVTKKICGLFSIDYLRLISSGCMLIIVDETKKQELEENLALESIKVTAIGRILSKEKGIQMVRDGKPEVIAPPEADELYKIIDFVV
jgi:hydrogenase expression/formation protein HypE